MRRVAVVALVVAALTWGLPGTQVEEAAASVSSTSAETPQIGAGPRAGTDGSVEMVRQIVQCGDLMYAVGRFPRVRNPGSSLPLTRTNAFAFRATAPHTVTSWAPRINGQVDTVACSPDGRFVVIGGTFTSVNGVTVRNLAKLSTSTGAPMPYPLGPAGRVAHVEIVTDAGGTRHLLVGGYFPGYLRSVGPASGRPDGYRLPAISGKYSYPSVRPHRTGVFNMTVSPDGRAVLMTGVFTSVGGQRHEQIVRLNLTAGGATVSAWTPRQLFRHCVGTMPFYARDAAWSPDMTRIYTATTGYRTWAEQSGPPSQRGGVRTGPCDATIAYPATETAFDGYSWINYTGCDSLYSVAADAGTVYSGGHQRWVSNGQACGEAGPGSAASPGLSHISPADGAHQPGARRGRGIGAQDLLRTPAGLWIGSDNAHDTDACGTRPDGSVQHDRMGICFLPG